MDEQWHRNYQNSDEFKKQAAETEFKGFLLLDARAARAVAIAEYPNAPPGHAMEWYADKLTDRYEKWYPPEKKVKATFDTWIYITISPDKLLRGSITDKNKLIKWVNDWFGIWHYKRWFVAIESGKNDEDPHYHIHALVNGLTRKLKKSGQYSPMMNSFNQVFPDKLITKHRFPKPKGKSYDVLFQTIQNEKLFELKVNYLDNELKGTHKNFAENFNVEGGDV